MLSTFYALVLKTGPYEKYIVMTNADYVTHMGSKTSKDLSICIGTWRNISVETWLQMGKAQREEVEAVEAKVETEKPLSVEELRKLRLKALSSHLETL